MEIENKDKEPLKCRIVNVMSSTKVLLKMEIDNKFVITVTPHKLICPKGNT